MKNKEVKMKRESVIEILRDHKKVLQQKYGVIKIGVFGSYARNQQRADSDRNNQREEKPPQFFEYQKRT